MANNAKSVLSTARGELGYSRWDDPEAGTKYGRWYEAQIDRTSGNYDFGASGVPYCAMFVSWVFAKAGASCVGIPGAYCPSVLSVGKSKGKTVSASDAKPGDVVLFDWEGDGISDHVGIVEINGGSYLQCIEGNTNNGCVARRTRAYSTVIGVIRPDYDGEAAPSKPSTGGASISVDGLWGPATTRALQKHFGTTQDGVVSDQYSGYKGSNPGLCSTSWDWRSPAYGRSDVMKALQRKIGTDVDGLAGPNTFRKLQACVGTVQDGCISRPSDCVREMQRKLNAGTF